MRRTALTLLVAALVLVPVGAVAVAGAQTQQAASNPCVGTVTEQPDRTTLFSIQGARGGGKTVAMTVGARPNGSVVGVHNDTAAGRWWSYDIDVLPNGNILQATTDSRDTLIEEIDPETGDHESERRFENVKDAHDVDLINGDELVMNDKPSGGDDRVLIYNLTREEVVWEYWFANHTDQFPRTGGDGFENDWTHNNDVEQIRDGVIMVSVRNFDKVVAINRSTKELEWTLGEDGNHSILFRQHNPDYIETEDGRATVLVADSRNDRVVEYTREDGEWNRTWVLRGGGLDEPRDADRLPNGNTLVADRHGHRILEVTPEGEVVWEMYAPWQPYDVERLGTGDESNGPTMADANETGVAELTGSADPSESDIEACYDHLTSYESSQLIPADELDGGIDPGTDEDPDRDDGDTDSSEPSDNDEPLLGTPTSDGGSGGFGPTPLAPVLGVVLVVAVVVGTVVRLRD